MQRVANQQFLSRRGSILYFRRAIPEAARAAFGGKQEVWVSLRTSNVAEARHRLATQLRLFDQTVARATQRPDPTFMEEAKPPPTAIEVDEAVRGWLAERLHVQAAKDFGRDSPDIECHLADNAHYEGLLLAGLRPGPAKLDRQLQTEWIADHLIRVHGWEIGQDDPLYRHLLSRVARGELEMGRRVREEIEFAPMAQRDAFFGEDAYRTDIERRRDRKGQRVVSIMALFEAYVAEAECKPATVKAWRQCLNNLIAHLKHDDASKVTPHDLVAWKEYLATPNTDGMKRSARTIRDKYLAAAKTLFKWAADNHKLEANPAASINMRVRKKPRLREAGLTDHEASLILSASLSHQHDAAHSLQAFARRWVPWLCAYTGARVGEISQLRSEDIRKEQGLACIRVTPEAGTQKGDKARVVPLHPHLLQQGFLDAVKGRAGPLFYDPANYRGGSEGNPQSKKVAERLAKWVRSIGVTDTEVQPNHGWRHRFKTQARLVGMDPETRDAIQGHSHRTEGESYGDQPPLALMRAVKLIPTYKIMPDGSVGASAPEADGLDASSAA